MTRRRPLHLGLLTPEWHLDEGGGIATYCRILARYAAWRGHQVTVIAAGDTRRAGSSGYPGVRVVQVAAAGLGAHEVAARVAHALGDLIDTGQTPDIVEAAEFGGIAALIPRLPEPPPLATRLHTPLALLLARNQSQPIYRDDAERCHLEARQVRASTLVTSPSAWLARQAVRLWRLPHVPLVVPNPADGRDLPPTPVRQPGPTRLLYLGRLEHRKGVLTLARAARRWLSEGADAHLTFAGGDTTWQGVAMSQQIRHALGPFAQPPTCQLTGRLSRADVDRQLAHTDLVVLPSLYENFPYACLEAMAWGKPVLATTGSGYEEILQHEQTGLLVPPADAGALTDALTAYAHDYDQLAIIGQQARSAVASLAPAQVGTQLCHLYATIARRSPTIRTTAALAPNV